MTRWLRVVVQPGWLASAGLVFALAVFGPDLLVLSLTGTWPSVPVLLLPLHVTLGAAGLYGVYRVFRFHPLTRPGYRQWLACTPWSAHQPLPHGPIHLVAQDVVVIGLVMAVAWAAGADIGNIPFAFVGSYLAVLALTELAVGEGLCAAAIAFGVGTALLLNERQADCYAVLAATYCVALLGLCRSLARFPWELKWADAFFWLDQRKLRERTLGWPLDMLGPRERVHGIRPADAAMLSLTVGWLSYVAMIMHARVYGVSDDSSPAFGLAMLVGVTRFGWYITGSVPPISLLGRLATGRLIIPAFDKVFVAPVAAFALGLAVPFLLRDAGVGATSAEAIAITVVMFAILSIGPSLREWRLTGGQRIGRIAGISGELLQVG
jgi:hypothetical protein